MTQETLPYGLYAPPRDGDEDDADDIEYTVDDTIAVGSTGMAEFKLTVNWPNDLDNPKVTIILPPEASIDSASISPSQVNEAIDTSAGDRAVFTHDTAATNDVITYRLRLQADQAAAAATIHYTFETDEFVGPVQRAELTEFVAP